MIEALIIPPGQGPVLQGSVVNFGFILLPSQKGAPQYPMTISTAVLVTVVTVVTGCYVNMEILTITVVTQQMLNPDTNPGLCCVFTWSCLLSAHHPLLVFRVQASQKG